MSFLASERPERDVGCEVAHEGFGGENEESSGEDDEDFESTHKQRKRKYNRLWQQRYWLRQAQTHAKK